MLRSPADGDWLFLGVLHHQILIHCIDAVSGCSKIDPEQKTDYGFDDDYEDEVFAYLKKKGGNHGHLSS